MERLVGTKANGRIGFTVMGFARIPISCGEFWRIPLHRVSFHHGLLPCQLVWQEAKVDKLDTSRDLRNLPSLTCARRFKRRAQVKLGGLGGRRCLACEPYSPTRRARGGQKGCRV
jgi:hypothetical protein